MSVHEKWPREYRVTRLVPRHGDEFFQYVIKHPAELHERAVPEKFLKPAT